jgi:ferredoxin
VVGTGGVGQATDVAEMMMAGATAVGVHTAPLLQGLAWFDKTLTRLEGWLEALGYTSPSELNGLILPHLQEPLSHAPLTFTFDAEVCTECGRCITVCAYRARHMTSPRDMLLDSTLCRSCGLCVTVCPTGALATR